MLCEDQYRLLFESSNDAICVLQDGKYIECNPKACEIYGLSREQIIGHTPFDFSSECQPGGENAHFRARTSAVMGWGEGSGREVSVDEERVFAPLIAGPAHCRRPLFPAPAAERCR